MLIWLDNFGEWIARNGLYISAALAQIADDQVIWMAMATSNQNQH
jgi:hypothetical protein